MLRGRRVQLFLPPRQSQLLAAPLLLRQARNRKALFWTPSGDYLSSLGVWARGDKNSVDVAQATHKRLLQQAGRLASESDTLLNKPCPVAPIRKGFHHDHHIVAAVVPRHAVRNIEGTEDSRRLDASREDY